MNYTIDKTHIDQLTSEQKQKLQELYPPKIGQKIITGKTGKNYVVKEIMRDGKLYVGSFKTWPSNVFPVLNENELIHSLVLVCSSIEMGHYKNNVVDDVVYPTWDITVTDALDGYYYEGETLLEVLWEAYKEIILG